MGRLQNFLVNLTLVIVSTVVVLVITEVALRATGAVPAGGVHTVSQEEFHAIPGMFSPNQTSLVRQNPSLPYEVDINSLGFRGDDFPIEKPPGEFRIVMTGDSFTFGDYVDNEHTLPARLGIELSKRCETVRVINAGVGGTSIYDQMNIVNRSLAVAPNMVILIFYENDVANLAGPRLWDELARNREIKSQFPYSLVYEFARSTALWNLLARTRGFVRATAERGNDHDHETTAAEVPPGERHLRIQYADLLGELRDFLVERGVPLVVTAFPSHHTLSGAKTWELIDWFVNVTVDLDVQYIDVARSLASSEYTTDRLYLLPEDGHASSLSYAMAAAGLADALSVQAPLASVCSSSRHKDDKR